LILLSAPDLVKQITFPKSDLYSDKSADVVFLTPAALGFAVFCNEAVLRSRFASSVIKDLLKFWQDHIPHDEGLLSYYNPY
jgi:hypothetical protein